MERFLDILVLVILTVNHCLLFLLLSPEYTEANHIALDDLYVGCFVDESPWTPSESDDSQKCMDVCSAKGYPFTFLRNGDACWCADDFQLSEAPRSDCSSRCSNGTIMYECGASSRLSVYLTTLPDYYWTVYSWISVPNLLEMFGESKLFVKKEFIVGENAGTSYFKAPEIEDKYQMSVWEAETSSFQNIYSKDPGAEGGTCKNGGVFTGSRCICRVGFSGPSCERVCRKNNFGPNCEGRCSSETSGCLGKLFCKSGEGCGCANGFTGADCMTSCAVTRTYGVDCSKRCGSCLGACNIYTGECEGGCQQGYVPPLCKDKWVDLIHNYLTLESVNHTTATLASDFRGAAAAVGGPLDAYYILQYKISLESEEWKLGSLLNVPLLEQRFVLKGLSPSTDYKARLVMYTTTGESYQGYDLPDLDFRTE